jgi:CHAT domain-containing protein
MITSKLKTILTDSGCSLIIYEQPQLANLYTDQSHQLDIIGVIFRQDFINLEVRANAIAEHYNPLTIEILQQVRLEDKAENNEVQFQALLDICKQVIVRLIADAEFKTIQPVTVNRVLESKYDANVIGWSMPLDLYYLRNENRQPCI